jgi:ankyrin repeat protein
MLACRYQKDEITRVLIEGGADVNAKDCYGATALILACRAGLGLDEIQLLLDRGAEINAKTNAGENALMGAVSRNYLDIAKFLIERGADIRAVDIDGESARDKARRFGAVRTASLLDSYLK